MKKIGFLFVAVFFIVGNAIAQDQQNKNPEQSNKIFHVEVFTASPFNLLAAFTGINFVQGKPAYELRVIDLQFARGAQSWGKCKQEPSENPRLAFSGLGLGFTAGKDLELGLVELRAPIVTLRIFHNIWVTSALTIMPLASHSTSHFGFSFGLTTAHK